MKLDNNTRDLLEYIDKNPYLKKTAENKQAIENLLKKDLITYGNCG